MKRMMILAWMLLAVSGLIGAGCQDQNTAAELLQGDWLIPRNQIFEGGPGKDGIPALLNPTMIAPSAASYLDDDDLIIGVKIGNDARAYPHPILDWHEIINDDIDGKSLAITYCPLTGSGIAWNRDLGGMRTTFGVSGLLYNTNLIPYDRGTNSNWSQMKLQCVNGPLSGRPAEIYPVVETTWKTWKELYPQTKVVSSSTGVNRPYGFFPYGDYKVSNSLLFPVSSDDPRLHKKERVLGVILGEKTRVYRVGQFPADIGVINDTLNSVPDVIAGSSGKDLAVGFERQLPDGTVLTFSPVQNSFPVLMEDNEGTQYDAFGKALSGPRAGINLKQARGYIAYWFAWATFHPGPEIYTP